MYNFVYNVYNKYTCTYNGISFIRTFHLFEQNIMAFDQGGSDNQGFTVFMYHIAGNFRRVQNYILYEYFRYENKTLKNLAPLNTCDL